MITGKCGSVTVINCGERYNQHHLVKYVATLPCEIYMFTYNSCKVHEHSYFVCYSRSIFAAR